MRQRGSYITLSACLGVAALSGCSAEDRIDEGRLVPIPVRDQTITAGELERALTPDTLHRGYVAASGADRQAFTTLIPALLGLTRPEHPSLDHWNALAGAIGYELERWHVGSDVYTVLRERTDRQRGGGTYVFRVAAADTGPTIILQAPHIYFDIGTGPLAIHAFFEARQRHRVRALYLGSMHRYQAGPGKRKERSRNPADPAHNARHLFHLATRLAADSAAGLRVVQLHGFGERADEDDVAVDAVVSATRDGLCESVASALLQHFDARDVRRYPHEFGELGGDGNAQRALLDGHATAAFVHIELSRSFRRFLLRSSTRQSRFLVALLEGVVPGDDIRSEP